MAVHETRSTHVTSRDVARVAGVSRSAVSQILNGNTTRFSETTRERVLAAAKYLDYRPSRAGRELVTGHSSLILLVVPNTTWGRQLQDVVDEIAVASAALGLSVVVRYAGLDIDLTIDSVLDLRPAIVVDFGVFDDVTRERLATAGLRILSRQPAETGSRADLNFVTGRIQAQRLLADGPRRIVYAHLADARDDTYGPTRLAGVEGYLQEVGAPAPDACHIPLDATGAYSALRPFLEASGALGIACYNDDVAIAVLAAVRISGRSVPDEISVVGVDRTDAGQLISPRLTTVAIDLPAILSRFLTAADLTRAPEAPHQAQTNIGEYVYLVPGETG